MNTLFLISGPSGVGKSRIIKAVMNNEIISFTTRSRRAKEVECKDYFFITEDKFFELKNNGGLFEASEYNGASGVNYYGVSREEFESKLQKGPAFNIVNFDGVISFIAKYDNCISIFISADRETCYRRMIDRGETKEFAERRISTYESEIFNKQFYDYVVDNPDGYMDETIEIVKAIVKGRSH